MILDSKDLLLLDAVQRDARQSTKELAKKTRIPITTVHNRLKKLEDQGVIQQYTIRPCYEALQKPVHAFIFVRVHSGRSQKDISAEIRSLGAQRVCIVTGETDLLVEVHVKSISALNTFVTQKLRFIDGVDQTRTTIVLDETIGSVL